jgi:TP901 family phage tail tape measure protein
MNNLLKVAVMLTAYDQMSREVQNACNKSKKELTDLKNHATSLFAKGAGLMGAGVAGFSLVGQTVKDFADLQEGALDLKAVMLDGNGVLNQKQFDEMHALAIKLGNELPGTTSDFHKMFETMVTTGITGKNVLDGVGESAANLALVIKKPYDEVGKGMAILKNAAGIKDGKEMLDFADTLARADQAGAKFEEMQNAYKKSSGVLNLLGLQGGEATKKVSALYAMLALKGSSGDVIGTNMTSIFSAIMDPKKMTELNEVMGKYGETLQFVDKNGNFAGLENMLAQIDKIKNLGLSQTDKGVLSQILMGAGGDSNMFKTLLSEGSAGVGNLLAKFANQANMMDKADLKKSGLNSQWEAFEGTLTNISATLGDMPGLTSLMKALNSMAGSIQKFLTEHPKVAKFAMAIVAITSALLMAAGAFLMVKGAIILATMAMKALGIVSMMNPFVLIAMAIVIAAALIYTYWDEIVEYFFKGINGIKKMFSAIGKFFSNAWQSIKDSFKETGKFLSGLGTYFFNAGANIAKSIWNGIKSLANKPVEALKSITQKMRDLLPFSPAKTGPFKDLHKIKIIETIAQSMKGAPMVSAMRNIVGQTANVGLQSRVGSTNGSGITLHYAPVITMGAASGKEDLMNILREHKDEIMRMLDNNKANKLRAKF